MRFCLALTVLALLCGGVSAQQQRELSADVETTGARPSPDGSYGRISRTDAQARIEELGYSDVTDLREDERGGWQAKATRGGQLYAVVVDAEGNAFALSDG